MLESCARLAEAAAAVPTVTEREARLAKAINDCLDSALDVLAESGALAGLAEAAHAHRVAGRRAGRQHPPPPELTAAIVAADGVLDAIDRTLYALVRSDLYKPGLVDKAVALLASRWLESPPGTSQALASALALQHGRSWVAAGRAVRRATAAAVADGEAQAGNETATGTRPPVAAAVQAISSQPTGAAITAASVATRLLQTACLAGADCDPLDVAVLVASATKQLHRTTTAESALPQIDLVAHTTEAGAAELSRQLLWEPGARSSSWRDRERALLESNFIAEAASVQQAVAALLKAGSFPADALVVTLSIGIDPEHRRGRGRRGRSERPLPASFQQGLLGLQGRSEGELPRSAARLLGLLPEQEEAGQQRGPQPADGAGREDELFALHGSDLLEGAREDWQPQLDPAAGHASNDEEGHNPADEAGGDDPHQLLHADPARHGIDLFALEQDDPWAATGMSAIDILELCAARDRSGADLGSFRAMLARSVADPDGQVPMGQRRDSRSIQAAALRVESRQRVPRRQRSKAGSVLGPAPAALDEVMVDGVAWEEAAGAARGPATPGAGTRAAATAEQPEDDDVAARTMAATLARLHIVRLFLGPGYAWANRHDDAVAQAPHPAAVVMDGYPALLRLGSIQYRRAAAMSRRRRQEVVRSTHNSVAAARLLAPRMQQTLPGVGLVADLVWEGHKCCMELDTERDLLRPAPVAPQELAWTAAAAEGRWPAEGAARDPTAEVLLLGPGLPKQLALGERSNKRQVARSRLLTASAASGTDLPAAGDAPLLQRSGVKRNLRSSRHSPIPEVAPELRAAARRVRRAGDELLQADAAYLIGAARTQDAMPVGLTADRQAMLRKFLNAPAEGVERAADGTVLIDGRPAPSNVQALVERKQRARGAGLVAKLVGAGDGEEERRLLEGASGAGASEAGDGDASEGKPGAGTAAGAVTPVLTMDLVPDLASPAELEADRQTALQRYSGAVAALKEANVQLLPPAIAARWQEGGLSPEEEAYLRARARLLTPAARLRRDILRGAGWDVVSLPLDHWRGMDRVKQAQYMRMLLPAALAKRR